MYAHILRSESDSKIEVLLGYTSSYFACPPRIALICLGSKRKAAPWGGFSFRVRECEPASSPDAVEQGCF